jgi:hypothetical protein
MGKAERSLFVFGLYMIAIVGLGFILLPTFILDLFKLKYGDDTWIRFVGLLASIIGVYYIVAARTKLNQLFIWTVWMRYYAVAFMIVLLVLDKVELPILIFAAIDGVAATWTLLSLEK